MLYSITLCKIATEYIVRNADYLIYYTLCAAQCHQDTEGGNWRI